MAKLKVRYTKSSGEAKTESYLQYVEHLANRYDTVDRSFYNAINLFLLILVTYFLVC